MTRRSRVRGSLAAAAAAAGIALAGSPVHAAAKTAPNPPLLVRAAVHAHAAAAAVPHGKAKGHLKQAARTAASSTLTAPDLTARATVGAIAAAPSEGLAVARAILQQPSTLKPAAVAVRVGSAPAAEAPVLGGVVRLPQGQVDGRPAGGSSGDTVDVWGVIAVAEGVAILALVATLWRRGRRSTAASR